MASRRDLRAARLHRDVVTRFYYAVFHAVCAALLTRQVEPKTHSGARSEFNRRFVHTELVSRSVGRALGDLQKGREDADYSRDLQFLQEDADEAALAATELREAVAQVLRTEGWMD